jgi:hypothetical protein
LNKAKTLNNEFVAQGRLIDAAKQVLLAFCHLQFRCIICSVYQFVSFLSCKVFVCICTCIIFSNQYLYVITG